MFQPSALAGGGVPRQVRWLPGIKACGQGASSVQASPFSDQTGRPAGMLLAGMVLQAWCLRLAAGSNRQAAGRQHAGSRQTEHPKK